MRNVPGWLVTLLVLSPLLERTDALMFPCAQEQMLYQAAGPFSGLFRWRERSRRRREERRQQRDRREQPPQPQFPQFPQFPPPQFPQPQFPQHFNDGLRQPQRPQDDGRRFPDDTSRFLANLSLEERALLGPIPPGVSLNPNEVQIVIQTNRERRKKNLRSLLIDPLQTSGCQGHAQTMRTKRRMYHSHMPHPSSATSWGENVAAGQSSGTTVVSDAWMHSPGHRRNILNPSYTHIGVGARGSYYCQLFHTSGRTSRQR